MVYYDSVAASVLHIKFFCIYKMVFNQFSAVR